MAVLSLPVEASPEPGGEAGVGGSISEIVFLVVMETVAKCHPEPALEVDLPRNGGKE